MKEHCNDEVSSSSSSSSSQEKNLRGTASTSTTDSGEQKKGAPIYDNSFPAEPEAVVKKKLEE